MLIVHRTASASFAGAGSGFSGCLRWLLGFSLLLLVGCGEAPREVVYADGGVLDLRTADLDRVVVLKGEWLARAGADSATFVSSSYDDAHWRPVPVEAYFREQGFPNEGLVWYRLHLRLPAEGPPLKGFVPYVTSAHAVYAARPGASPVLLASSGRPALPAEKIVRSRRPVSFMLPQDTSLVLIWKVANVGYLNGGPSYAVQLGSADAVDAMLLWRIAYVFTCFGLYLVIALSFLVYWWYHRRDMLSLAVGLISFVMAVRTVVLSGALEHMFPVFFDFDARITLEGLSYVVLNGLFAFLLWAFFPKEFASLSLGRWRLHPPAGIATHDRGLSGDSPAQAPVWLRRFNSAAFVFAVAFSTMFTVLMLFIPPGGISYLLAVTRWLSLGLMVPALVIIGLAVRYRRALAFGMVLGFSLVFAGSVHDVLLAMGVFKGHPYVATYTFLVFVLVQSSVLARRNAHYTLLARRSAVELRKEVEQRTKELRAATIAAQAANLAKGQFLTAVSHELRTPLASILGYTRMLKEELGGRLEPQQMEFFHIISVSAQRLLGLINDILDIAKIEAGRLELAMAPVEVATVLKEVMDQLYPLALEKDLTLQADHEKASLYVHADAMRLRQALLNLLSNAIKFTESGGIRVRVYETTYRDRPACAIAVKDTGPGISADFLPYLFDRFTQESRTYGRTQRGTGLGLTISRELVSRMDGHITVESQVGVGSTFTIVLPRAAPEQVSAFEPYTSRSLHNA